MIGMASAYANCNLTLCGGYSVTAGVCVNGGNYSGDTVLSLHNSTGNIVAYNDDSDSCGINAVGSELFYIPPIGSSCESYQLRQYCYEGKQCSGTSVVYISQLSASPTYAPTSK